MPQGIRFRLPFLRFVLFVPALAALGWGFAHREDISALPPPAPTATAQAGPIAVFFTAPHAFDGEYAGGPDEALVRAIDGARRRVDIASYDLDLLSVARALLRAKARGVSVRIVVDTDNWLTEALDLLRAEGIPVVGDGREALMHDKFVVIDDAEVWAGSMNLTVNDAYRNDNNLLRIASAELAERFTAEFEEMFRAKRFGVSSPSAKAADPVETDAGTVEVYFAPEDGVASRVIRAIRGARKSIHFLAFSFTSDAIADAMLGRLPDGLSLLGVMEKTQARSNAGTEFEPLRAAGAAVYLDANPRNMHHKVILLDGEIVITGSYNFSESAEKKNDEILLLLRCPNLTEPFESEFRRIFTEAAGISGETPVRFSLQTPYPDAPVGFADASALLRIRGI
jgi:phosphatidylserine/phosphatidylglycerophosphate/cardiolipin synthase-like enzyme